MNFNKFPIISRYLNHVSKYFNLSLLASTKFQLFIVAVLTVLVYLNTLPNQFVWDDNTFANFPLTKDFKYLPQLLKGALPPPHEGDFRPLKGVILLLDYQLFGLEPFWYHVQAMLIHLSSTLLVYFVTKKILDLMSQPKAGPPLAENVNFVPFLTALLFGLHPIHTEAITFITSSTDIIGISFFLSAFYLYLAAFERFKGRVPRLTFSIILAFLAFISYEITLVLPAIIILFDLTVSKISKKEFLSRIKTYGLYFALVTFYFLLRFPILGLKQENTLPENNPFLTSMTMIKAFFEYLKITIFPLNLSVNHLIPNDIPALFYIDYEREAFLSQKITDPETLVAIVALLLIFLSILFFYKKAPLVTFCIFWFLISLAPVSNILPLNNFMAERYLYLASYGYSLFVALIFVYAYKSFKNSRPAQSIIICLFLTLAALLGIQTLLRNSQWKDSKSLWGRELAINPGSVLANHNLGNAYFIEGNLELALAHLETAYFNNQINNIDVIIHLGYAYQKSGKPIRAIEKYKTALTLAPADFIAIYRLANAYHQAGLEQLAIEHYQRAIGIEPRFYDAHVDLGLLYVSQKRDAQAASEFKLASEIRPNLVIAWQNLGAVYIKMKKYDLARDALTKALKIEPDNGEVKEMLGSVERLKNIQKLIDK